MSSATSRPGEGFVGLSEPGSRLSEMSWSCFGALVVV